MTNNNLNFSCCHLSPCVKQIDISVVSYHIRQTNMSYTHEKEEEEEEDERKKHEKKKTERKQKLQPTRNKYHKMH